MTCRCADKEPHDNKSSAWSIWGLKKAIYNGVDHGVLVMSTYSSV